jgi:mannose-1-phosphate guanylyltransferase
VSRIRPRVHAVILAGGAGTRFWPLSRASFPKPLLRVSGAETLLGATLARARHFAPHEAVWLVCGSDHAARMRRLGGLAPQRVLVEPRMRNTAAAVAIAAHRIAAKDPEAVLAVLPADHHVPDARAFSRAIHAAARAAAEEGALVTLGVRPTRPETGYGYIGIGPPAGRRHPGLHRVARFVEKPERRRAERYLRTGRYLWNAGVFVWSARRILEEIEVCAPEVFRPLAPVARAAGAPRREFDRAVRAAYRRVPELPVDKAVLERSRSVWCLPVDFHWSDVGSWHSLAEELGVGGSVSRVMEGEALLCDAGGNLVRAHERLVVLLGVEGLAVIDAGDALLVTSLARSAEVRQVVSILRRRRRKGLL